MNTFYLFDYYQHKNKINYATWNEFKSYKDEISLTEEVDKNFESLKKKYFEWLAELSNTYNKNLFSSILFDSSPLRSNKFYFAFKVFYLFELLNKNGYKKLVYKGNDIKLSYTLKMISKNTKVLYSSNFSRIEFLKYKIYNSKLFLVLLNFTKANYFFFRKIISRGIFINKKSIKSDITIFTYMPSETESSDNLNYFQSRYLPYISNYLIKNKLKVNYVFLGSFNSKSKVLDLIKKKYLNINFKTLDEYLTLTQSFSIFFKFHKIFFYNLFRIHTSFFKNLIFFNFYYPLKPLIFNSFFGTDLLINIYFKSLFNYYLKKNKIKKIIYSFENLYWEQYMLGKPDIIYYGYLNATSIVSKNNLRIYLNNKNLSKSYIKRNEPNYIIVDSDFKKNRLIEYGWKENKILFTENYLNESINNNIKNSKLSISKLLVICGYDINESKFQLINLCKLLNTKKIKLKILIKFHPDNNLEKFVNHKFKNLNYHISYVGLDKLISECDLIYLSNSTSSIFEVLKKKKNFIVSSGKDNFNLNPIFNKNQIKFSYDEDSLYKLLNKPYNFKLTQNKKSINFTL